VNKSAADIGQQAKQPEHSDNNGYPEQHEYLLRSFADGNAAPARSSCDAFTLNQKRLRRATQNQRIQTATPAIGKNAQDQRRGHT
jgi:hypothetical protein